MSSSEDVIKNTSNIVLEQIAYIKNELLRQSPFTCLDNEKIDKEPHQISAFLDGIEALKSGGIILADEVGLGKTIEAGLIIKYYLKQKKNHILICVPPTLMMQWKEELEDKLEIQAQVISRSIVENKDSLNHYVREFHKSKEPLVLISTYTYASRFLVLQKFKDIMWDLVVIDEAHNMRNLYKNTKKAVNLFNTTKKIPKVLLSATPLQNDLRDLFSLVSFIDERIFTDSRVFEQKYNNEKKYPELRENLKHVLHRTLRKDIIGRMIFTERICKTYDFKLSQDELELYIAVNKYLVSDDLYGIPNSNKNLITLVVRKLLSSSSFALVETFKVIKNRLENISDAKLKKSSADEGFSAFLDLLDCEEKDDFLEENENPIEVYRKAQIEQELEVVNGIIDKASKITVNTKMESLINALKITFHYLRENNLPEKVVIFTESLRTQSYIYQTLSENGYDQDDIVLFNGNTSDYRSTYIYKQWRALHFNEASNGKSMDFKQAMVDYFKNNGKIFVSTDSGAEGLNLQFCSTIINYDLPWNPQKIEQRIGRCHRYGQKNNVLAINFLNSGNEADKRVYEILSKKFKLFEGVCGASDEAIGLLSDGLNFEKEVLEIYQNSMSGKISSDFDKLSKKIDKLSNVKMDKSVKSVLRVKNGTKIEEELSLTEKKYKYFLIERDTWNKYINDYIRLSDPYLLVDNVSFSELGINHGYIFIGGLIDGNAFKNMTLLLFDEKFNNISVKNNEIIKALKHVSNNQIHNLKVNSNEKEVYAKLYDKATAISNEMVTRKNERLINYNYKKIDNWIENKKELLMIELTNMKEEIDSKNEELSTLPKNFRLIADQKKYIAGLKTKLDNKQKKYYEEIEKINQKGSDEKRAFRQSLIKDYIYNALCMIKF